MARYQLDGIIGRYPWMLVYSVSDEFQVYDGHSSFIDNLVLTSDFGYFGMPSDNAAPTDTSVAVSSWCFHKF